MADGEFSFYILVFDIKFSFRILENDKRDLLRTGWKVIIHAVAYIGYSK